jgi:hypothetical protein
VIPRIKRSRDNRIGRPWLRKIIGEGLSEAEQSAGQLTTVAADWIPTFLRSLWSDSRALLSIFSLLVVTPIVTIYLLIDWKRLIATIERSPGSFAGRGQSASSLPFIMRSRCGLSVGPWLRSPSAWRGRGEMFSSVRSLSHGNRRKPLLRRMWQVSPLLPAYWVCWRKPLADELGRTRAALTAVIAFIVWWSYLIGHVMNNIMGFGS